MVVGGEGLPPWYTPASLLLLTGFSLYSPCLSGTLSTCGSLQAGGGRHSSVRRSISASGHDTHSYGSRLFVTTLNTGSCNSCDALGDVSAWLPRGYDVYVIGVSPVEKRRAGGQPRAKASRGLLRPSWQHQSSSYHNSHSLFSVLTGHANAMKTASLHLVPSVND